MAKRAWWLLAGGLAVAGVAATRPAAAPVSTPPKAVYMMDATTASGFGAGGASAGRALAMLMGRGGGVAHQLTLRLGSVLPPSGGAPEADHFMPAGARLGASVPLVSPQPAAGGAPAEKEGGAPDNFRRPSGRLLIFWGCGDHAGPGQPVILDFAKLAQGQMPPGLFTATVPVEIGPTASNSRTFGSWPNGKASRQPDASSSLLGDHRVAGNYSPEIKFTLAQDFLGALSAHSADVASGGTALSWSPVDRATGYYAWAMGGRDMGQNGADMVWWTSAAARQFGGGFADFLAPATVARLIGQRLVMPPAQTSCTVPAEAKAAAGPMMIAFLNAYGPEQSFAAPPRPANPRIAWHPDWTVKARFRATTTMMLGMPGMGDAGSGDDASAPKRKRCKPSLGGMLAGALSGEKICDR